VITTYGIAVDPIDKQLYVAETTINKVVACGAALSNAATDQSSGQTFCISGADGWPELGTGTVFNTWTPSSPIFTN
jgi:hypothetical protein